MADLERLLSSLAADVDWPATPPVSLRLEPHRRWQRPGLAVALAVVAGAIAVAVAVPGARSAILRFLHLGGVTVERVQVAPRAPERPLTADLGRVADRTAAAAALGGPVRLPPGGGRPRLYVSGAIVSTVLTTPQPVLLSEFRSGPQDYLLKKIAGASTKVEWLEVRGTPALWIAGKRHVLIVLPSAPPRLAGNVLVWQARGVTYRLEGRTLSKQRALRLAAEIHGT